MQTRQFMSKNFSTMNITQEAEQMTQTQGLTTEDKVRLFDRWCTLVTGIKTGRFTTIEYTNRMENLLRDCENYGFIPDSHYKV